MIFEWKENNVNLQEFESYLKENFQNYQGNQANSNLELFFSSELTEEEKEDIQTFWDNLSPSNYKSASQLQEEENELQEAINTMKIACLSKSWDAMTTIERKVILNIKPTRLEMGLE